MFVSSDAGALVNVDQQCLDSTTISRISLTVIGAKLKSCSHVEYASQPTEYLELQGASPLRELLSAFSHF
jgi:hypothetical protein